MPVFEIMERNAIMEVHVLAIDLDRPIKVDFRLKCGRSAVEIAMGTCAFTFSNSTFALARSEKVLADSLFFVEESEPLQAERAAASNK